MVVGVGISAVKTSPPRAALAIIEIPTIPLSGAVRNPIFPPSLDPQR